MTRHHAIALDCSLAIGVANSACRFCKLKVRSEVLPVEFNFSNANIRATLGIYLLYNWLLVVLESTRKLVPVLAVLSDPHLNVAKEFWTFSSSNHLATYFIVLYENRLVDLLVQ